MYNKNALGVTFLQAKTIFRSNWLHIPLHKYGFALVTDTWYFYHKSYISKEICYVHICIFLVISHLDYCYVILYQKAEYEISKTKQMCAKLVLNR